MTNIDGRYVSTQHVYRPLTRDRPHVIAEAHRCALEKMGSELIRKLPLDTPVMVKLNRSEKFVPADDEIQIAVEVELRRCDRMQVTVQDIMLVPPPPPEPPKPKTWWDNWIAPLFEEVQYDGPRG